MADRKQQLLEAFNEDESDEDIETVDETHDVDGEGLASDDTSLVADEFGSEAGEDADEGAGKDEKRKEEVEKQLEKDPLLKGIKKLAKGLPKTADAASKGAKDAPVAKTIQQTEKEAAEAGEAPKAWKVATREHWAKLPKEVREQVQQRETEITQFIGRHGAAIQHKAQFDETVQPFLPFIAAQQSTPMKAFHSLMTTAARLTTGAPQAKALVISEIMRNYGIDAKTLDEVLSAQMNGNAPPAHQQQQSSAPPAWAQPLLSFMQETKQARTEREKRTEQEAAAELATFEKKPFFSDLQSDIGFLMERASAKGELLTLDQAYAKARKMNPEVDKILTQREKAAAGSGETAVTRARKAAASVRGAPGVGVVVKANGKASDKPLDRKAAIAAAFDAAQEE